MKADYRDFLESLLVFFVCLLSSFVLLSIHSSYFTPYINKEFMVEFSFFLTFVTALFVGYEWIEARKRKETEKE